MCGIFGFCVYEPTRTTSIDLPALTKRMMLLAEKRGTEAAGLAIKVNHEIRVHKDSIKPRLFVQATETKAILNAIKEAQVNRSKMFILGHARLAYTGGLNNPSTNHPILTDHCVGVHNGLLLNDLELRNQYFQIRFTSDLDSETIFRLIDLSVTRDTDAIAAVENAFEKLKGEVSIAYFSKSNDNFVLATNVGSLYFADISSLGVRFFASERNSVEQIVNLLSSKSFSKENEVITKLEPGSAIDIATGLEPQIFKNIQTGVSNSRDQSVLFHSSPTPSLTDSPRLLLRCSRCILPITFPFISFNQDGVCNYCLNFVPAKPKGSDALVSQLISGSQSKRCIVALSGGRDSCFGLHFMKRVLGFEVVAYTYDWSMVTDEARRNSSRMCAALGVEHIVRSADISKKIENIRLNVNAWLEKPELGTVPLFMAGDKQFFHFAKQVSQETGINNVVFCAGNPLEKTRFKSGFAGVREPENSAMLGSTSLGTFKLFSYYLGAAIRNPRYLNKSVWDSLFAFYSTYINRSNFTYLYDFIEWDEDLIRNSLTSVYGWETAKDSSSDWRIGDGTAAFYNHIYYTVAGFSEHDTFLSNQIRYGKIDRASAMLKSVIYNAPRPASMSKYSELVGFDLEKALLTIDRIPKLC